MHFATFLLLDALQSFDRSGDEADQSPSLAAFCAAARRWIARDTRDEFDWALCGRARHALAFGPCGTDRSITGHGGAFGGGTAI